MYKRQKYWHKRIVRAGKNTLKPYNENPDNLILIKDDILFIDFGPIFDDWEADFGRTYVLGDDKSKIKLMNNLSSAWEDCKNYFVSKKKLVVLNFTNMPSIKQRFMAGSLEEKLLVI